MRSSFGLSVFICVHLWLNPFIKAHASTPEIRTPSAPAGPRINGPSVFGVRPGHPFIYHIPTTGERPLAFSAAKLPPGLHLDTAKGDITGTLNEPGQCDVKLHAKNSKGQA